MITAAHNVHHAGLGPAHHVVVDVPGHRAGETMSIESRAFEILADWVQRFEPAFDIACIRLPVDVPGWAPWCELADPIDAATHPMQVTVAGWTDAPLRPSGSEAGSGAVGSEMASGRGEARLMRATDLVTDLLPQRLFYLTDTTAGQSGSPVWVDGQDGRPIVVGVHTSNVSQAPPGMRRANSAIRLTAEIIALIDQWRGAV